MRDANGPVALRSFKWSVISIVAVPQSVLSATSGSIRVARHAGMKLAISATPPSSAEVAANVIGSLRRRSSGDPPESTPQHERHGDAGGEPDGDEEQAAHEHQPQHR